MRGEQACLVNLRDVLGENATSRLHLSRTALSWSEKLNNVNVKMMRKRQWRSMSNIKALRFHPPFAYHGLTWPSAWAAFTGALLVVQATICSWIYKNLQYTWKTIWPKSLTWEICLAKAPFLSNRGRSMRYAGTWSLWKYQLLITQIALKSCLCPHSYSESKS